MVERGAPAEPVPTSIDERITRALTEAGRPLSVAELRAACRVRNATLHARLAALVASARVIRADDGFRLAAD